MSEETTNPILWFDNGDPEMQEAYERARSTFRLLWRELSWERRRIIPALDLACVKTMFADKPLEECGSDDQVEQMWLDEIEFDGRLITGKLLNQPHQLESVKQGERYTFAFERLTDWMYAISSKVYGAYTVNLMRSRMSLAERQAHDESWGFSFGEPGNVLLSPEDSADVEHPMSINMVSSLDDYLKKHPDVINQPDDRGWTFLHHQSLAGNALVVEALLKRGADRTLETNDGDLAIDLARLLGWKRVVSLLAK
ncbi:MAG TPA: DUF2314 domain-containing protein [Verrucomicrobiae bacterium]|nr:DUF2314 domain-containing protein [Verrucomicrobiae bacterium]